MECILLDIRNFYRSITYLMLEMMSLFRKIPVMNQDIFLVLVVVKQEALSIVLTGSYAGRAGPGRSTRHMDHWTVLTMFLEIILWWNAGYMWTFLTWTKALMEVISLIKLLMLMRTSTWSTVTADRKRYSACHPNLRRSFIKALQFSLNLLRDLVDSLWFYLQSAIL